MAKADMKALFAAGAHFGHQTSRWHPKMAPYIHSKRENIHIINLEKTVACIDTATSFITDVVAGGKQVLLVGTKRQAQDAVRAAADKTAMPYVTERWLGGMLTNRNTIGGRVKHLKRLEEDMASGKLASRYAKLEVQRFQEEIDLMNHNYGGIKQMTQLPAAVYVTDIRTDNNAVLEARKLHIPIVGIVDTNTDPTLIDYPIPANDDAIKAIALITDYIAEAIEAGKQKAQKAAAKATDTAKKEEATTDE